MGMYPSADLFYGFWLTDEMNEFIIETLKDGDSAYDFLYEKLEDSKEFNYGQGCAMSDPIHFVCIEESLHCADWEPTLITESLAMGEDWPGLLLDKAKDLFGECKEVPQIGWWLVADFS